MASYLSSYCFMIYQRVCVCVCRNYRWACICQVTGHRITPVTTSAFQRLHIMKFSSHSHSGPVCGAVHGCRAWAALSEGETVTQASVICWLCSRLWRGEKENMRSHKGGFHGPGPRVTGPHLHPGCSKESPSPTVKAWPLLVLTRELSWGVSHFK